MITPGTRVRRYEVTSLLGAGGMGEVFLARDVELERTVALKVLGDAPDADGERSRRFVQEARAAIALNHPNIAHVYDVGEENGTRFIAMEYVEGETLRSRLTRERLKLAEALEIATQIAAALASAHAQGIVHRDVKPENVMIRPDGYVKVLDFGLAKLTARAGTAEAPTEVVHTAPGLVLGTMQYMSPEQLRSDDVDARSDVFSLGVVLYEMLTGERPFQASTPSGVIAAILTDDPPAPRDVSPAVRTIVGTALAKKREQRYPTALEMAEALKNAQRETSRIRSGDLPTQALTQVIAVPRRVPWKSIAAVLAAIALLAAGAYFLNQRRIVTAARARLPELEKLAADRQYFAAWDLAGELAPLLPGEPAIARTLATVGGAIDVKTTPAGAQVFLERVLPDGTLAPRTLAGTTPLTKFALPLGDYVLRVEKSGFLPVARTLALAPTPLEGVLVPARLPRLDWTLTPATAAPPRMVRVTGGRYRLAAWGRPTNDAATLDDFFIDQFEVTNREFREFIDAGGYERAELWKTLPFEKVAELKDTTGLNAPRRWANQSYPVGRDDYPVTDVSWHEAAAYAAFRGKSLPTIYEWDKAARDGQTTFLGAIFPWGVVPSGAGDVARRANFRGAGTLPVDALPSGMSPFGAYNLAGNVSEWCLNTWGDRVITAGGDYNSPTYSFGDFGAVPAMYSASTLGFRCVKRAGPATGDQGGGPIARDALVIETNPVGDAEFAKIARFYDYPDAPLNAKVVERRETEAWTFERIEFDGWHGARATAFLYLPKHVKPPYQVIHYVPASDVDLGRRSLEASLEASCGSFVRGGRAVFGVVLRGYLGRVHGNLKQYDWSTEEWADWTIERTTDLRRGLDYLETRKDLDLTRLGYFGPSAGGYLGVIVAGLEDRYDAVGLMGIGLYPDEPARCIAKASRVNFAPRIRAPKLVLHGRWDETHPLESQTMPLYNLMPEPKRLVVVDGGHVPPAEVVRRTFAEFYDERFGKVAR